MKSRRGFTLVELLVVIGIIALLISILLPALNKARQQAMMVKCQANMRTLMQAVQMYASEHNAQIPFCNWATNVNTPWSNNGVTYGEGWLFLGDPNLRTGFGGDLDGSWSTTHPPADGMQTGDLWMYLKQAGVYHCPADLPDYWTGSEWLTSYLMNGAQFDYGSTKVKPPGLKLTQFRESDNCVLFWEAMEQLVEGQQNTGTVWNDGSSYPTEEVMADRHYKGANVAFIDGHVEWWTQADYNYQAGLPLTAVFPAVSDPTQPSKLWCSPLEPNGGGTQGSNRGG